MFAHHIDQILQVTNLHSFVVDPRRPTAVVGVGDRADCVGQMGEFVRPQILLVSLALLASSCAASRVEHVAPDESRPHVTWEIREGGESGDDRFVCGSTEPSRPCALAASTDQSASEATVRLFLHAAATDTSYLGLMTPPFLDRAAKEREVSITVPRGSQPVLSMVSGRVSAKPGAYAFTIALDATESGAQVPVRITQQIPVAVHAPSSSTTASARATAPR
jgi:hypothetical protein